MFQVDIAPFDLGQHHVSLSPDWEAFDSDEESFRDITVEAFLFIERDRVLVHIEVMGTARLTCDRTLRPFDQEVEGQFSVLFAIPDTAKPADKTDEYQEVREWHPSDTKLDLTDVVRDTLMLALPQRRVAPGAEEEDIQTTFGEPDEDGEGPVDPRWEKLRKLKQSGGEGESPE